MIKNAYVLLLITLAGSVQAITWAEYYAAHQAEVNAAVTIAPHHLNLADKGLTDLNGFDAVPGLNMLQWLYLEKNELRELPPTIFQGLNALCRLSLHLNQLRELPPTVFQGLNMLQRLSLDNNQLRELPPTVLQSLNALQRLSLHNNQLSELPSTIFQNLNTLRVLSLSHNQLSELSPTIFQNLNRLQRLLLAGNRLVVLPPTVLRSLGMLQRLHLSTNQLKELPPTIFQGLSALQELYLYRNKLSELPPTIFQGLNALQELGLYDNQLSELPPTIFQGLNTLRSLYLHNNQLMALSPTIFQNLGMLQKLYLSNNHLTALPPTIFKTLDALQELCLENTRISGTNAKLRATLQVSNNVDLLFKTPAQEHAEALFTAIRQSNITTVRQLIGDLLNGRIRNPEGAAIPVSTLRDYDGNNLLHAAIISAARHLASIAGKSHSVQGSEEEKDAQRAKLARDKLVINASYMKLIEAIFACGEQCAQEMLSVPNAEGQSVVKAAIAKLGLYNSPITEALLKLGFPAVRVRAKLESSGSAATQRLAEPRLSDESKAK